MNENQELISVEKENFKKKIDDKLEKIIENKKTNILFFICGVCVILVYLGLYLFLQPIVDEEVRTDITNNLIPWEVKEGESFIYALLTRPFNLNITEYGLYRPRWLAFVVQFLDENLFLHITRIIPIFGNRQPFYILAAFLNVFSMYYFLKTIWKKAPKGFLFFISSTILMFQNYQVTTYWRARSAKLLSVAACIFLITYALKLLEEKIEKKKIYKLLYSIPIFMLMTLDEQVLAVVAMATVLLIFFSILDKKVNIGSVIYSISCFIYLTFYLWWGKALFAHFTGQMGTHGHTIGGAVAGISLTTIWESISILVSTVPKLCFMSFIVFALIWIGLIVCLMINKKEKFIERFKKMIIALFLLLAAICLLMLMIDAHEDIYENACLWISVYPLIASIIMFSSLLYLVSNSDIKYNNIKYPVLTLGIIISLVYNCSNVDSYYGAYLSSKGGINSEVTDLIVTKDDIIINVYDESELNFDNQSIVAVLNTIFATDDFNTTKIISGTKQDTSYIEDTFSCYLIVRQNRNLNLKLEFENYEEFESVTILINGKEIKNISINSQTLQENVFVGNEINRACKVELVFNRYDESTYSQNDILLEELSMN